MSRKNCLFFAVQAEKGRFLIDFGEILLLGFTKKSIKTFFSAISAGQGTIKEISHEKAQKSQKSY